MAAVTWYEHDIADTARHEAGHCVAALWLRLPVRAASLVPTDDAWGTMRYAFEDTDPTDSRATIIVKLAGYLATGYAPVTWPPDYADALNCERESLGSTLREFEITRDEYRELCGIAMAMVKRPLFREAVERVAEALLASVYLGGNQIAALA